MSNQQVPTIKEKTLTDKVLAKVHEMKSSGYLSLPDNYSPENALKSAWFILQELEDKDKKKALEVCSQESVANSLLKMITEALNPSRKQCYFIVRGNKLCCDRSYFGNIALAKRSGLSYHKPVIIYEGDEFIYEIDSESGCKKVIKHSQKVENIDITKIKGAYCVYHLANGIKDVEIMTLPQIKLSWMQGQMKGNSGAHTNFTDQMCAKTVTSRAMKLIINTSDDSYLYEKADINDASDVINTEANTTDISFEEINQDAPTNGTTSNQAPRSKIIQNEEIPITEPTGTQAKF